MKKSILLIFISLSLNIYSLPKIVSKGNSNEKSIALTFDDGPNTSSMLSILNLLKEYNIKATFFVIGQEVEHSHTALKRAFDEGHEIANHSYTHSNFSKLDEKTLEFELDGTNNTILHIIGKKPKIYRAPYGIFSRSLKIASALDLTPVMWDLDTLDWSSKTTSQSIIEHIKLNVKKNDIILMHTLQHNFKSYEALKILIPYLIKEGYTFKTVSQITNKEAYYSNPDVEKPLKKLLEPSLELNHDINKDDKHLKENFKIDLTPYDSIGSFSQL
ncbi:MAG: polysaccharide deacetylase family protein [Fusobacteriaceae bacterium]